MPEYATNPFREPSGRRSVPVVGFAFMALVLLLTIGALYRYGAQVRSEIDDFAIANSDSLQWSLAQLEVEYLHMDRALAAASSDNPQSIAEFSRTFDIFYSRINTVLDGRGFNEVVSKSPVNAQVARLERFIADTAAIIDSGPDALAGMLPELRLRSRALALDVREVSVQGVREFAENAKARRERVFSALMRLASLAATLLAAITGGFMVTWWLWRFGMRQARSQRLAKARLEAVIKTAIDAVIVIDQDAQVLEFNGAAEKIFGYTRAEAIGQRLSDLIVPEHMIAAHEAGFRRHRAGGVPRIAGHGLIGLQARRKDGTLFPAELSVTATRMGREEIFVGYLRDITERVAAEQELIDARDKAQAGERAQSAFVAVMSHEMRTPLNGLLGTLDILQETKLDAQQTRFVQAMQQAGEILLQHVNNTLDVERLDAGKLSLTREAFDPKALAEQLVAAQANDAATRGNTLSALMVGKVPHRVEGDAMRIRQVLLNLVSNATKFTRDGTITIEIEYFDETGELEYRVIDTGVGIQPEETARIFDDFVTLDPAQSREHTGSGLGLSIARRLVRAMGGDIGVESEPGIGSAFWLNLPAPVAQDRAQERSAADERATADAGEQPACDILVVEDNDINRVVLCEMLRRGGHSYEEARDGQEGVEFAERRRFDLIMLDLNMPRLNGLEATRVIRTGTGPNRATPIIAITANVLPEVRDQLIAEGVTKVMPKPITRRLLDQAVRDALTQGAAERKAPAAPSFIAVAPQGPKAKPGQPRIEAYLIDPETYDDLAGSLGPELFADTVARFSDECETTIAQLQRADLRANLPELARVAHKLAGSAALLGAQRLHSLLKDIELIGRGHDEAPKPEQLSELLAALGPQWRDTRDRLDWLALRAGADAPPPPGQSGRETGSAGPNGRHIDSIDT